MADSKEMVRQSINLLEYPLWFQDERMAEANEETFVWQDREGYIYRCGYKIPVKTDVIFLLYLLLQSQNADYAPIISVSRYQILNNCGLKMNSKSYDRLIDSLERWKMVGIKFSGSFYDGKAYQTINFGVIDSWEIDKKSKLLKVYFSNRFIEMMLGKGFFKFINFTEFKQLHSPLATRLYEILSKSFHGRSFWEIEAVKLAEKIPMKERYAAHIVPKIKTAVTRINDYTNANFGLTIRKVKRGQTILSFTLEAETTKKPVTSPKKSTPQPAPIQETPELKVILDLLPPERRHQRTILEMILGYYGVRGAEYVTRNIRYANKYANWNYRLYLFKALKADYGLAMQEDQEAMRHIATAGVEKPEESKMLQAELRRKEEQEEATKKRARVYLKALSDSERENLEKEAISGMEADIRAIVLKKGPGSKILLSLAMEKVATQHLQEADAPNQPDLINLEQEAQA